MSDSKSAVEPESDMQRLILRDAENMARIAILAYGKGEMEVFASTIINAAKIVEAVYKRDGN